MSGLAQRTATPKELDFLHAAGAIKLRASNTALISLPLLAYAVQRVASKSHLVPAILDLAKACSHLPGMTVDLTPTMCAASPAPLPIQAPVQLPECTTVWETFPKHYSLNEKLQNQAPVHQEMSKFVAWLSTPIMMNRAGKFSADRTVQNIVKNVYLYLGYTHWQYNLWEFSLDLFLDLDIYSNYISFQVAKKNGRACLTQQLSNARKVCTFLKVDADSHKEARINAVVDWLITLSKQIVTILPKPVTDIAALEEEGKWLPAEELVVVLDKFRLEAMRHVPLDEGVCLSQYAARLVHDAALSATMFGHIPPPRLSCIRTLQVPWKSGCADAECVRGPCGHCCKGNTVEMRGEDMWLVFSHHKNKGKWDGSVIQFRVPEELKRLLHLFLVRGHPVLSSGSPYVFSDQKNRPLLEACQLTFHWEAILKRAGAPVVFPPTM